MGWVVLGWSEEGGRREFLGVEGEVIVSSPTHTRGNKLRDSCVWGFYKRPRYNCCGFRAALTDRFIGQDFWGNFKVQGHKFESKQEFEVDDETKMKEGTRLLSASAEWGKGGYLKWVENGEKKGIKVGEAGRFFVEMVDYVPLGGGLGEEEGEGR